MYLADSLNREISELNGKGHEPSWKLFSSSLGSDSSLAANLVQIGILAYFLAKFLPPGVTPIQEPGIQKSTHQKSTGSAEKYTAHKHSPEKQTAKKHLGKVSKQQKNAAL